jgi:hypothetical protein
MPAVCGTCSVAKNFYLWADRTPKDALATSLVQPLWAVGCGACWWLQQKRVRTKAQKRIPVRKRLAQSRLKFDHSQPNGRPRLCPLERRSTGASFSDRDWGLRSTKLANMYFAAGSVFRFKTCGWMSEKPASQSSGAGSRRQGSLQGWELPNGGARQGRSCRFHTRTSEPLMSPCPSASY